MLSKMGILSTSEDGSFGDELEEQIRMLLDDERRNDLSVNRSDSAPPTVERSLNGDGDDDYGNGLIRPEDELRSHPAYRAYYHSNVNLNPRLPPPLPCTSTSTSTRTGLGFQLQQQQGSLDHSIISRSENGDQDYLSPVQSGNLRPVMRNFPFGNFYASGNGLNYSDFLATQMYALNLNEDGSFRHSSRLSIGEESLGNLAHNHVLNINQLNREESHGNLVHNPVLNPNQLNREESHGNLVHNRILNANHLNREESHGNLANNRILNPNQLNSQSPPAKLTLHFLEEFKNNSSKINYFHLSQIAGHVVEFSVDQYGSRFIQQKLETATVEEKKMVFFEAMPEALVLITDVFGNYVIQKLFEVGLSSHRRDLVKLISSHVLSLSLQVYGCRVIQKIIEVADLELKLQLVEELAGHVMVCVRDQNGNHVIQKCIEHIPVDYVGFIVTPFFGQVANLSIHPYGCRVMQRVLEHCQKPFIQNRFMDEILHSVKELAQDQFGNYVIQHVLVHGKQHERSKIIHEVADIIVEMSQQKFASNVVEKCLKYASPSEHRLLVNQMLGSTEDNEPLQAMMKDQYGNYVVQKVLETSDKPLCDFILSRIKIHMNNIKKLTYGKHIYTRIEKLFLVRGERKAGKSSYATSSDRG